MTIRGAKERRLNKGEFVKDHHGTVFMIANVEKRSDVQNNMDRFLLQAVDGTTYSNIGAYELTDATEAEVEEALARRKEEMGDAKE